MSNFIKYLTFLLSLTIFGNVHANVVDSLKIAYTDAKSDSQKIDILLDLALEVQYYDKKEANKYAKEAHKLATIVPDEVGIAQSLYLLGSIAYYSSEKDSAIMYYQQSLQLFKKLGEDNGIGNCLAGIGDCYYFADDYSESDKFYKEALIYYKKSGYQLGMANTYISLGDQNYSMDAYTLASEYYQKAHEIYQEQNSLLGMANSINCIADIGYAQGFYNQSLWDYRKAIGMFNEINDRLGLANCYKRIGDIHQQLNNYDSSFVYFNKAQAIYQEIASKSGVATCIRSTGLTHKIKGNLDRAFTYFEQAYLIYQEVGDKLGMTNSYYNMADVYFEKRDYENAIYYATKAFQGAVSLKSAEIVLTTSEILSQIYAEIRDYENAYFYQTINKQTADTLHSAENIRNITQMQLQFKFNQEKKEQQVEQMKKDLIQEEKLLTQKYYTIAGVVGICFAVIMALTFYRSYKLTEKTKVVLQEKNEIIEKRNKDITDSIKYAKTLQKAILPQKSTLYNVFPNSFVFYNPRDIVSGDFHWVHRINNHFYLAAADCTGHGVPGAFMSLLGNEFLHQVVNNDTLPEPHSVLLELDRKIKESVHVYEEHKYAKDGMDLALCSIDLDTLQLKYSGAYNPLYIFRNEELTTLEAAKGSVGSFTEHTKIELHEFQLQKGDTLYLFSDGYVDQFGGPKCKKYMKSRFQKFLASIVSEPMDKQKDLLRENMKQWMMDYKQVDDMLILGIKI